MLVNSQLNECKGCEDINSLINEIDCYIASKAKILLDNRKFALTRTIDEIHLHDAIIYRQILYKRTLNPSYLCDVDIRDIMSNAKKTIYN